MEGLCARIIIADKNFTELAIAGKTLEDLISTDSLFIFWPKISTFKRIFNVLKYLLEFRRQKKKMNEYLKLEKDYRVGENLTTSHELWKEIDSKQNDLVEAWQLTVINSARGSSWGQVVMSILSRGIPSKRLNRGLRECLYVFCLIL